MGATSHQRKESSREETGGGSSYTTRSRPADKLCSWAKAVEAAIRSRGAAERSDEDLEQKEAEGEGVVYFKKEAKAEHYTEHSQLLTATGQQPAVLTPSETRTVTRVQRCWDAAHQGWGPSAHRAAEAFGDTWEVLLRDEASWVPHGWVEPQLATGADR